MTKMTGAVFLDRDGTINVEKNYLYRVEDWEWIPGALEAIRGFNHMGYLVIVVTNQAGVARGYYTREDVEHLHKFVMASARKEGAFIHGIYYCPHHFRYGAIRDCGCRKPKSGLFLQAVKDFNISLEESYMIGDKLSDMQAAVPIGIKPILVLTGYGQSELAKAREKNFEVAGNLYEAYKMIENEG